MNRPGSWLRLTVLVLIPITTACGQRPVSGSTPNPSVAVSPPAAPTPVATLFSTTPGSSAGVIACPPEQSLGTNAALAARVNGQGISLDLYNRQLAFAQAALSRQGIDVKSPDASEALRSLKNQVLDQMIDDVIIAQQAEKEEIRVTQVDVDARLGRFVQEASLDKLNAYLAQQQVTLADFCSQIRSSILGDVMIKRVTAPLPTSAEQAHVRQILVSTPTLAKALIERLGAGEDFAAVARQYSIDEASKATGGDLGWIPVGMLPQELDTFVFRNQIAVNQISEVITTSLGYHIIQVTEREKWRALAPEMIQAAQQRAWLAWLQAVREGTKVERFVQP